MASKNEAAASLSLDEAKGRQKVLRRKITGGCKHIGNLVGASGSRREVRHLLEELKAQLAEADAINERLVELLDDPEGATQHEVHLMYQTSVDGAEEAVEQYLASRENDAASGVDAEAQQLQRALVEAAQRVRDVRRELLDAEAALRNLGRATGSVVEPEPPPEEEVRPEDSVSVVDNPSRPAPTWTRPIPRPQSPLAEETLRDLEAPDAWIDRYCTGQEPSVTYATDGRGSSVRTELDVYSGRSLDWFEWIGLFHALVHCTNKSPGEKLALLKKSLRGDTADMVYGLGGGTAAYRDALRRLKENCGSRAVMRAAHLQALDRIEPPRGDPVSFKRYAERVRTHLFNLTCIGETSHADLIERLAQRLPVADRLAWNDGRGAGLERRSITQFGEWMCTRAAAYQNAYAIASEQLSRSTYGSGSRGEQRVSPQQTGRQPNRSARAHHGAAGSDGRSDRVRQAPGPPYCFKCEGEHALADCSFFKEMTVQDRTAFCIRRGMCFGCFGVRHVTRDCRSKRSCGINGCRLSHHRLLHSDAAPIQSTVARPTPTAPDVVMARPHSAVSRPATRTIAFGVLQLDAISSDGRRVAANVMLDGGSDSTIFREGFIRKLGLQGRRQLLRIAGVANASTSYPDSEHLTLQIETAFGETVYVSGSTVRSITQAVPVIDWERLRDRWPHFQDLPPLRSSSGQVDLLLGLDYATLMAPSDSRCGQENEPIAVRTRLGWVLQGVVDGGVTNRSIRIHQALVTTDLNDQLVDQLRRFCDTDKFGSETATPCMSEEDRRAVDMIEKGIEKLDIGYRAPVLWKRGAPPVLPDNKVIAEQRLRSLLNKFRRSSEYEEHYRRAMEKNFEEGYAHRLKPEESDTSGAYYLPHFGVPKAPGSQELRLVFDAAAKFNQRSLNDYIASGPPLQNPLPAVLIQFREGAIAWSADVSAMFSRIRLRPEDRRYHRFLWLERDGSTSICEMDRVTFGVRCSPFVAIRTMWRVADDAGASMADVAQAVRRNFYVDDYLGSATTVADAASITTRVQGVLATGDFHLRHWLSNSPQLLAALLPEKTTQEGKTETSLGLASDVPEAVLGIVWRQSSDTLGFRIRLAEVEYTRIGLVAKVAGLFDPLGVAAPMTIKAKIRLRALGLRGLDWTDPISEPDRVWWEEYFQTIEQLRDVEFERCLFPDEDRIVRIELHTFVDASEEACAAATYVRSVYVGEAVQVRLVKAVTKLAPQKTLSVCKLELNAAVLGVRLVQFVSKALTRNIAARYYWTDSSTVRNWVRSASSQYQVYVSHRIGEIQLNSEPTEWRFVNGRINPADAATRSTIEAEALPRTWLEGPAFLQEDKSGWPPDLPWMVVQDEMKAVHVHFGSSTPCDWNSVTLNLRDLPTLIRLDGRYHALVQQCQQEAFPEEMARLTKRKQLRSTSSLLPLNPFLDEDGLIRLGGRLARAKLPYDRIHPPILPGRHPFARLIIRVFHESMHSAGTDFLLAHIQQHFWLIAGREAVKRERKECVPCRRLRPKATDQMMADVHRARLEAHQPPFTYTSVDYFGPINVRYGRGTIKRWGALFTCLVTRAVYVDVAASLSADDFLLVFRRFVGMYRKPAQIFSDNGTCFVGAERMLREELERLKGSDHLAEEMRTLGVRWVFQPAQTPHFGGSHESLVRSVKKAFYAALETEEKGMRVLSDEMLRTLLAEVSGLLNSRPLTYASSDPDDFRPLTPNDFLNRPPVADLPAGDFVHSMPRDHYRYVQRMTNLFWDLWHGSFIQSMNRRGKWRTQERNLAVGDVVLDDWKNAPRGRWRTGIVVKVYPGSDGLVRAVDVRFPTGTMNRGANQLALLEPNSTATAVPATTASGENAPAN